MANKKKPQSPEELQQDISQHPERGQLAGKDLVAFDSVRVQVDIPRQLYQQLLEIAGVLGMTKTQIITVALAAYVSLPGVVALVSRWQEVKAEQFKVSRATIRSKVFGSFKRVARAARARLHPSDQDK